ncbi:AAA family ATPase [Candidatus Uhrbacteria bacterium]|nr:AAA family ATPase [Candidatus Uhrbacteria bacterium]
MSRLFVLTGPSGAGKSSIAHALFAQPELRIEKFITCTTRKPRLGEKHGKDYWFINEADFKKQIAENGFFEWAHVYGHYYGSSVQEMKRVLQGSNTVLIILDVQGAKTIKLLYPETTIIFLDASKDSLIHRLEARGDSAEDIDRRMERFEEEKRFRSLSDFTIVNADGDLAAAIESVKLIILAQ